jgi:uncharacterized protein involved in exopolysaccharide biosynthesis
MNDDSSLKGMLDIVWRGKWLVLAITAVITLGTVVAAMLAPVKYTATTVVSPVSGDQNGSMGGLGSLASQFGGIASLAGLGGGGATMRAETVAVLQSGVLTQRYIEDHDLLPILFPKRWDATRKQWIADGSKTPTPWLGNEYFNDQIRNINDNVKSGLVTLTITWSDPVQAAQWANDLVKVTNDYLRAKAIEKSERHIEYLKQQAAATDIAQLRSAIYSVLESEIKSAMLARGNDEYALKVIDPATVPERRSSPKRTVWVSVGFMSGLFLAIAFVFFRRSWSVA